MGVNMGWLAWLGGSSKASDGGAIYDRVEGGRTIPLDQGELEWISEEAEREASSLDQIFDGLGGSLDKVKMQAWEAAPPQIAERALKGLAGERYLRGEYRSAANTAIKSLSFSGMNGGMNDAILWQMLARIHMTIGRFETASQLLAHAEKSYAKYYKNEADFLRNEWISAMESLQSDIRSRRYPKPCNSMHVPTSLTGWFDHAQEF